MKILRLEVHAFKRIRTAIIEAAGKSQVLGGPNSSGKSSAIDAMLSALAGQKHTCVRPIHEGEGKALIGLDLDNGLKVRKKITAGNVTLEVFDADGNKVPQPQALLSRLTGGTAFDVSEFVHAAPVEQAKVLARLAGVDMDAVKAQRERFYSTRRDLGRELRRLQAKLGAFPELTLVPDEEVSAADVQRRLDAANEELARQEQMIRSRDRLLDALDSANNSEEVARVELAARTRRAADARLALETAQQEVQKLPPLADRAAIAAEFDQIHAVNLRVRQKREALQTVAEIQEVTTAHEAAQREIDALDRGVLEKMDSAQLPVEGLAFADDGVTFNGIPFDQCGEAERYMVAAAVGLRTIPKDGIRVLLMRTGGTLDEDSLRKMIDMAESDDAQLWVEVPRAEGATVVFEEGGVKG